MDPYDSPLRSLIVVPIANSLPHSLLRNRQDLDKLKPDMAAKGFAIYGLVSQPQSEADSAKEEWGISYDIIGSPDVSLVKHLADEKIINLVISDLAAELVALTFWV